MDRVDPLVPGDDLEPVPDENKEQEIDDFLSDMMAEPTGEAELQEQEDAQASGSDEEEIAQEQEDVETVESQETAQEETQETGEAVDAVELTKEDEEIVTRLGEDLDATFRKIAGTEPRQDATQAEPAQETPEPAPAQIQEPAPQDIAYPRFQMSQADVENIEKDPTQMFPALAENIARSAIDTVLAHIKNNAQDYMPDVGPRVTQALETYAENQRYVQNLAELYQRQYPRHEGIMRTVGRVTSEVTRDNPGKAPHTLIEEVARRVDELVTAAGGGNARKSNPSASLRNTPGPSRASSSRSAQSGEEQDVAELLEM
jgi:hypothetical protein